MKRHPNVEHINQLLIQSIANLQYAAKLATTLRDGDEPLVGEEQMYQIHDNFVEAADSVDLLLFDIEEDHEDSN